MDHSGPPRTGRDSLKPTLGMGWWDGLTEQAKGRPSRVGQNKGSARWGSFHFLPYLHSLPPVPRTPDSPLTLGDLGEKHLAGKIQFASPHSIGSRRRQMPSPSPCPFLSTREDQIKQPLLEQPVASSTIFGFFLLREADHRCPESKVCRLKLLCVCTAQEDHKHHLFGVCSPVAYKAKKAPSVSSGPNPAQTQSSGKAALSGTWSPPTRYTEPPGLQQLKREVSAALPLGDGSRKAVYCVLTPAWHNPLPDL